MQGLHLKISSSLCSHDQISRSLAPQERSA